ncbi:hypothetical protein MSG28_004782 [Choristoneura fumiferana]|uniref:Uncharacterized protein n=1 Tax=Choristoneura fumiferana TaxID=7141 RepID=A0ACC0K7K7_CHOFU|nr:hypothetical protein MSG28_004782 [Choristoneura fumiferana]
MDRPSRHKVKNNKKPTPKSPKRKKSDGPTCSMFLHDLTKKLALKKNQEEESPLNIVQSPMKIETLQEFAPELLPVDTVFVPPPTIEIDNTKDVPMTELHASNKKPFRMPKMPVVTSEVLKQAVQRRMVTTEDAAVNTGGEVDVASEIARHVGTLKKISLIAEEFNRKTAKNLKDIVDSVQEDLMKKLEEIQAEQQQAMKVDQPMQVEHADIEKAGTSKKEEV